MKYCSALYDSFLAHPNQRDPDTRLQLPKAATCLKQQVMDSVLSFRLMYFSGVAFVMELLQ